MSDQPSAADEIMDGVYRALRSHGYADVTMQDIADECSKSKSLLHYHYDTKEDLLVAFLDEVITDSAARIREHAGDPPIDRLVGFIGWFVFEADAVDREAFHIALLELRTQGPFNERIREQLVRSDRLLRGTVADILESGIESGVFRDVDVEETAALIVATVDGARTRQITLTGGADETDVGRDGEGGEAPGTTVDGLLETPYTRVVAEATLRRIVRPLLAEGVELPELSDGLGVMTDDEPE
jgi:AcrR family transcriptional regulator